MIQSEANEGLGIGIFPSIEAAFLEFCFNLILQFFINFRNEDTKRLWLDHAFRHFLTSDVMGTTVDLKACDTYIELSIKAATGNLCSKTIPIQLLSDLFDVITLDQCEKLFSTIERNIILWKSEEFFTPIRNNLLRICNGLCS